ncbi:purine-cytosine permease family protein [Cupriavidus basilensis]
MRIKREYQSWVANETLEDYALRYAARSYRRWSPFTLANTAIGGVSFLALEAIGASITLSFGFQNAFPAILLVCLLIFLIGLPVAYHASVANVDIDLLTRGAGFGYAGSTITSLIYASFTFIFFALESAILAQALTIATGLNLTLGYLVCSLVIVPMVFFGVTLINKLQMWTQPLWVLLLVLPFVYILRHDPGVLAQWAAFTGRDGASPAFNVLAFGAATGVLFSLMGQIGEQVDYLRFLPERTAQNRWSWWSALLLAGPGWILIGGLKVLAGSLLAVLAVQAGLATGKAMEPMHMYVWAYGQVFDQPEVVMTVALLFVVVSQIKINVTNAYAGSLAWSNVFVRLAHYHPGRVVWLVFNVLIALLLTLLGIFSTLEAVLSVYSNLVIAWLGALAADLVVLKPLGISPRHIEFRRAYLYAFNPVGCGAVLIASMAGIGAYSGLLGPWRKPIRPLSRWAPRSPAPS